MLVKTGLLVVSNPKQIGKILPSVQKQVKNTLYIQLLSALTEPLGNFYTNTFNSWPKYSQTIFGIYSQAATHCRNLDVRVLLSGLKYKNLGKIQTHSNIDLVIFDKLHNQSDIDNFIKAKVSNTTQGCNVLTLDAGKFENFEENVKSIGGTHNHTVLGGTFDRLHVAHKLLLSEAALRSEAMVTVGVTEENMLKGKTLWELIEDMDTRVHNVRDFLTDICPELEYNVVPISDPFGPAITDPTMGIIVVSAETLRGGEKINEIRRSKNLNELDIVPVELLDEPYPNPIEETKVSSSTGRIRLLGSLLRPPKQVDLPKKPYIIGLTGGVASGKTGVANWLSKLGAVIINCDQIGHYVYKAGKPCHKALVEHFGKEVLGSDGEIDRKALGAIVFKSPEQLNNLNNLVWPAIAEEVQNMIKAQTDGVIVVEAAVLLSAKWDNYCHEVWTTLVPREEAIERLKQRNGFTDEQAASRIDSQPSNSSFVKNSNVVICPQWEVEYTQQQVEKAWKLLQERIES